MMKMLYHPCFSLLVLFIVSCFFQSCYSFRVLTGNRRNGSYPRPYDKGFVGIYGDPSNFQRERINEGALETGDQEHLYEGVSPRQSCPGMVGPFSDGAYYCSAREFGYCDRRSGTCFCNTGYKGIDCTECQDSHFKIGYHCFPKKLCPNDCSGAGTCNYNNGTCTCLPHRIGAQCETLLCSARSKLCLTCTETHCLQCAGGYYLTGDDRVCGSCYDFDPRCAGCIKEEGCTVCADSVLTSVRRSGYRTSDLLLPEEEINREFSITLPFGTKSPESFAEAESYFVASTPDKPLRNASITCSQGLQNDSSWTCSQFKESHIVCGHYGVFSFLYPNYEIAEGANYIRMYVQRSGGGYGNVSLNYYIKHYSTNDSDVVATAPYTTVQQLTFEDGVVQRSFLITILDDNLVEENEIFQVVLETPEGGGSVGAQFRCNVTILDDDVYKTAPALTRALANTSTARAGDVFSMYIQASLPTGMPQRVGGDEFLAILENDLSSPSSPSSKRLAPRMYFPVTDLGNGQYQVTSPPGGVQEQGQYQLRIFHVFPNAIQGDYFYDAFFETVAVSRLDHAVNFTWDAGRIIPRGSDYISIRWRGGIRISTSGVYKFAVKADDYARLWINNLLVIDHTSEREAFRESTKSVYLQQGIAEVVMEYVEVQGVAYAKLLWDGGGNGTMQVIPQNKLVTLYEIDASPIQVNIKSTYTSALYTEVYGDGIGDGVGGVYGDGGIPSNPINTLTPSTFTIYPRDIYGNLRDDDEEYFLSTQPFAASLFLIQGDGNGDKDGSSGGMAIPTLIPTLTYNPSDHSFTGTYIPNIAGVYALNITYTSSPDLPPSHIVGSPYALRVHPSAPCGPNSLVSPLPSPLYIEAGRCVDFTISLRDCGNNLVREGGAGVTVYMYRVDYFNLTETNEPNPPDSPSSAPTLYPTPAPTLTFDSYYSYPYPPRQPDKGVGGVGAAGLASGGGGWRVGEVIRYGVVSDEQTGNYTARVCPVIAGVYELHVLYSGDEVGVDGVGGVSNQNERVMDRFYSQSLALGDGSFTGAYIGNSPYTLVCTHSKASVITSTVHGEGLITATTNIPSHILLTVRDAYGNVLRTPLYTPNITIFLDKTPNVPTSVYNYQNGSYLLSYTPSLVGLNYISILVNSHHIYMSPFSVVIKDGETRGTFSYAVGDGLYVGEAGVEGLFGVYAYDGDGNRKGHYDDVFTYTITGTNFSVKSDLTPCPLPAPASLSAVCDGVYGGAYYATYTPLFTGSFTIRIYLNTSGVWEELSTSPYTLIIAPAPPSASTILVYGDVYTQTAGGNGVVYLRMRDEFANRVTQGGWGIEGAIIAVATEWGTVQPFTKGQGRQDEFNYKGFNRGLPIYYSNISDNLDGTYTLTYTIPQTGMYVYRLSVAEPGLNVTYYNDTQFGFLFAREDGRQYGYGIDGEGDADGHVLGDPLNTGSAVSWTGDLGGVPGERGGRGDNAYFGKFVSLVVDSVKVELSPYPSPSPSPSPSYTPAFGRTYIPLSATPSAPPSPTPLPFPYNFRHHYWSARWVGTITPPSVGVFKFYIHIDTNSELRVYVGEKDGRSNGGDDMGTGMGMGIMIANITLNDRSQTTTFYNFTSTTRHFFKIEFIHHTGDAYMGMEWESISTPRVPIPPTAYHHYANISHTNLTITPTILCSECSTVFGVQGVSVHGAMKNNSYNDGVKEVVVGHTYSFLVYARDTYGNLLQRGGDSVGMFAIRDGDVYGEDEKYGGMTGVGGDGGFDGGGVAFRGKAMDYGNSTYLVSYYPTRAGLYRMYITVKTPSSLPTPTPPSPSASVGALGEIIMSTPYLAQNSPYIIIVKPDTIYTERCVAVGAGLGGGIAGEILAFQILYRDRYNNPTSVQDINEVLVKVTVTNVVNGDVMVIPSLNITKGNTNVSITYTMQRAGRYALTIQLATPTPTYKPILGSPFFITIASDKGDAASVVLRGLGMRSAGTNNTNIFEVTVNDRFANIHSTGGDKLYVRLLGDANFTVANMYVVPRCLDNLNGLYTCTYTPNNPGTHWLVVRLLQLQPRAPGGWGLVGSYFDDEDGAWNVNASPGVKRVDSMVRFVWDDGVMVTPAPLPAPTLTLLAHPLTGQSARWEGYVVAPRGGSWSFRIACQNLHVTVIVEDVMVVDTVTNTSAKISMVQDGVYAIRVMATTRGLEVNTGALPRSIDLLWSTNIIPEQPVSSFFLYPFADEVRGSPFPVDVHR